VGHGRSDRDTPSSRAPKPDGSKSAQWALSEKDKTRVFAPAATAAAGIAQGMQVAGVVGIESAAHLVSGRTEFSRRRNRHKSEVSFAVDPESAESTILSWSVDMLGDKHFEIVDEILVASRLAVDDLGVAAALDRLGKMGRLFGALEARSLSRYVRLNERVVELAEGVTRGSRACWYSQLGVSFSWTRDSSRISWKSST
jgi:hypothetical protein